MIFKFLGSFKETFEPQLYLEFLPSQNPQVGKHSKKSIFSVLTHLKCSKRTQMYDCPLSIFGGELVYADAASSRSLLKGSHAKIDILKFFVWKLSQRCFLEVSQWHERLLSQKLREVSCTFGYDRGTLSRSKSVKTI